MKDKIIKIVIFIIVCIVIYFAIYNYTSQINSKNKNNTYESTSESENYREDYINKYIETLVSYNFSNGFEMLSDNSKKIFSNDVSRYSEQIMNTTKIMNRMPGGLTLDLVNEFNMKKYIMIEYELLSKSYDYIQNNDTYYADEFSVFKTINLIEYSPNVFKIDIKLY